MLTEAPWERVKFLGWENTESLGFTLGGVKKGFYNLAKHKIKTAIGQGDYMSELAKKSRPQFRNIHVTQLVHYRLPAAGVMSILHRISGAGMFLTLPIVLLFFDWSITSELSYARLMEVFDFTIVKLLLCGLAWAFLHHLLAGIRHLVSDMHIGLAKEQSAAWGKGVLIGGVALSVLAWLKIFGVF